MEIQSSWWLCCWFSDSLFSILLWMGNPITTCHEKNSLEMTTNCNTTMNPIMYKNSMYKISGHRCCTNTCSHRLVTWIVNQYCYKDSHGKIANEPVHQNRITPSTFKLCPRELKAIQTFCERVLPRQCFNKPVAREFEKIPMSTLAPAANNACTHSTWPCGNGWFRWKRPQVWNWPRKCNLTFGWIPTPPDARGYKTKLPLHPTQKTRPHRSGDYAFKTGAPNPLPPIARVRNNESILVVHGPSLWPCQMYSYTFSMPSHHLFAATYIEPHAFQCKKITLSNMTWRPPQAG